MKAFPCITSSVSVNMSEKLLRYIFHLAELNQLNNGILVFLYCVFIESFREKSTRHINILKAIIRVTIVRVACFQNFKKTIKKIGCYLIYVITCIIINNITRLKDMFLAVCSSHDTFSKKKEEALVIQKSTTNIHYLANGLLYVGSSLKPIAKKKVQNAFKERAILKKSAIYLKVGHLKIETVSKVGHCEFCRSRISVKTTLPSLGNFRGDVVVGKDESHFVSPAVRLGQDVTEAFKVHSRKSQFDYFRVDMCTLRACFPSGSSIQ